MKERTYGLFNKVPEDKTRCIKSIHGGERWPSFHQCRRKRGYGPDGLYCKIHDPEAVKKRKEESHARLEFKIKLDADRGLRSSSTSDLIAELERRRPKCSVDTCSHIGSELCGLCIWGVFIAQENGEVKDNFKPKEDR